MKKPPSGSEINITFANHTFKSVCTLKLDTRILVIYKQIYIKLSLIPQHYYKIFFLST